MITRIVPGFTSSAGLSVLGVRSRESIAGSESQISLASLFREPIFVDGCGHEVLSLAYGAAYHTPGAMNQHVVRCPRSPAGNAQEIADLRAPASRDTQQHIHFETGPFSVATVAEMPARKQGTKVCRKTRKFAEESRGNRRATTNRLLDQTSSLQQLCSTGINHRHYSLNPVESGCCSTGVGRIKSKDWAVICNRIIPKLQTIWLKKVTLVVAKLPNLGYPDVALPLSITKEC
jgi:hypothetical protein